MKDDFECHITLPASTENFLKSAYPLGWKFSMIDGDPTLGDGVKCYLTCHSSNYDEIKLKMRTALIYLAERYIPFIRAKIEQTVFDTATNDLSGP